VIERDRVITTVTKAKAVRPWVEKMITLGKKDTLHSRRQAAAFLQTPAAVKKVFDTLAPRFSQQDGGYTRIVRLGPRRGDGAEEVVIEILGTELKKRAEDRRKRKEERLKRQQEESEGAEGAEVAPEEAATT
jgi:large subunit ribosomal protein L17